MAIVLASLALVPDLVLSARGRVQFVTCLSWVVESSNWASQGSRILYMYMCMYVCWYVCMYVCIRAGTDYRLIDKCKANNMIM